MFNFESIIQSLYICQIKLEDAENNSIKNGRKVIGKLEEKARELIAELDNEERRKSEAQKNLRKTERGINEYMYRSSEDNKNSDRIKVESHLERNANI